MTIQYIFGNILKQIRENRGISQEKLAFDSSLDRTYISMLERGKRKPTINTIFSICNALHMKPSELLQLVELEFDNQPH
ncbi:helix-turn-helix transcriptional regulator [Paenibacillus oryzisoli]|uniref:helix-turn-helix domain-containing protein n=1 Tax=Paenibacillus oryzisoli TaxID=1850517 RepID=UPI003D2D1F99